MRSITIIAAIMALLASCDKENSEKNNPYKSLELTTKSIEFVQKGNDFSFAFIDKIDAQTKGSYIISPLSMQFLLGMVLDGAKGETAEQICSVLGYGEGEVDAVNEYCLSLLNQLPKMDKKTKLSIANAMFVDDGWPILDSYKSTVSKYYKAEVTNLDFSDNTRSLKAINGWCDKNTNGMIPKVLDSVDPSILAYLMNALYFKSQWAEKFPKSATADEDFTNGAGNKDKVKMMKQEKKFQYNENDIFQAVRMPYGNKVFSMYALLPKEGHTVSDICSFLKNESWEQFSGYMRTHIVDLWIPRFETRYEIKLNDILSEMGMPLAFSPAGADFSALSPAALCLRFVKQDAIIKVDEEGTEAAAVSTAAFGKNAAAEPEERAVFHADHPFLYLITESSTGVVLFAGKYNGK